MGLFDSICGESGLIVETRQRLIPIVEKNKTWEPLALPIAGTNDRGGTMDVPGKLDANMKAFVAAGKQFVYEDEDVKASKVGLEEILNEIRGDGSGAVWSAQRVSFTLIEEGVYRAIVAAVKENGATAWKRYAQRGLQTPDPVLPNRKKTKPKPPKVDATTKRLCKAILAKPTDDGARKVYVDHLLERGDAQGKLLSILPALHKMKWDAIAAIVLPEAKPVYSAADKTALLGALAEFAAFRAWGTRFKPACGEDQFFGYTDDPDIGGGVEPYCKAVRKKYAGMPELLAAVDANEKAWRERDDDDDDED